MTVTKETLTDSLFTKNDLTRDEASGLLESLLELIKATLESRDDLLISGFGKFCVKGKGNRRGRNPATGEELTLAARKVVTFKCSSVLKDKLNKNR